MAYCTGAVAESPAAQTREQWLDERRKGIGGSDSPVILGVSPFKNPLELWKEKMGLAVDDSAETPAIKRGRVLEPVAADQYAETTGRKLMRKTAILNHPEHPWMLGNIDRHIVSTNGKGPGVLEIKCPGLQVFAKCKREGLPDYYQVQLQHYLSVTGWQWGAFCVFNAERWELLHFDVERDNDLIGMIIDRGERFWKHVRFKRPPEVEPAQELDLPKVGGELVTIETPAWAAAADELAQARELRQEAEELEALAKHRIQKIMDAHGATVAEGAGLRVYWKPQGGRKTFDKKKLAKEHPEIDLAAYEKVGRPSRPFKPFFLKQRAAA